MMYDLKLKRDTPAIFYAECMCETMQTLHHYTKHATDSVCKSVHLQMEQKSAWSSAELCADEEGASVTLNYGTEKKWSSKK